AAYSGTTWTSPFSRLGSYSSRLPIAWVDAVYPAAVRTILYSSASVWFSLKLAAPMTIGPPVPLLIPLVRLLACAKSWAATAEVLWSTSVALFSATSFGVSSASATLSSAATRSGLAALALIAAITLSASCRCLPSLSTTSLLPANIATGPAATEAFISLAEIHTFAAVAPARRIPRARRSGRGVTSRSVTAKTPSSSSASPATSSPPATTWPPATLMPRPKPSAMIWPRPPPATSAARDAVATTWTAAVRKPAARYGTDSGSSTWYSSCQPDSPMPRAASRTSGSTSRSPVYALASSGGIANTVSARITAASPKPTALNEIRVSSDRVG